MRSRSGQVRSGNHTNFTSALGELVDTAEKLGIVEKSGTWYSYEGAKLGQGRDKVLAHLDEHPAMQQQLRGQLIKQARLASVTPASVIGATAAAAQGAVA